MGIGDIIKSALDIVKSTLGLTLPDKDCFKYTMAAEHEGEQGHITNVPEMEASSPPPQYSVSTSVSQAVP